MSNLTLCEKIEDKLQKQVSKSMTTYLENKFTVTFKGSMPTPGECNLFSRQSLAKEFEESQIGLMELCEEHYDEGEWAEQLTMLVDLLIPLAYYKAYATCEEWSQLKRYYCGIEMFNGMDYLFLENYAHQEELRTDMKCHASATPYREKSDEDMQRLCDLCNQNDYFLRHSELLDQTMVRILIQELEKGRIPQERLNGIYPASLFLEPVPIESEYIFYID